MNIKRFFASVMAAMIAIAAPIAGAAEPLSMTASAAEQQELLTFRLNDVFPGSNYLQCGYSDERCAYCIVKKNQYEHRINKFIRIDYDEWRRTGKFSYTEVKSDVDLRDVSSFTFNGDYVSYYYKGAYHVLKTDISSNKLVKLYEAEKAENITNDGYTFYVAENTDTVLKYSIISPNGTKKEYSMTYDPSYEGDSANFFVNSYNKDDDEYLAIMAAKDPGQASTDPFAGAEYSIYGIKRDGSRVFIDEGMGLNKGDSENGIGASPLFGGLFWYDKNGQMCWFSIEDHKVYKMKKDTIPEFNPGLYNVMWDERFDNLHIIYYSYRGNVSCYIVDIKTGDLLIKKNGFLNYWYSDGILYQEDSEGVVLYDENLDEIGRYDEKLSDTFKYSKTTFIGEALYALAYSSEGSGIYNAWLVDRDMNKVSRMFTGSSFDQKDDQLFSYQDANKNVICFTTSGDGIYHPTIPEEEMVIFDDEMSVFVSGVFPRGTKLNVGIKKNDGGSYTYDVTSVNERDETVKNNGEVTLGIKLPQEFEGASVNVYAISEGKRTKLDTAFQGGMLSVKTAELGEFELVKEQTAVEPDPEPEDTGDITTLTEKNVGITVKGKIPGGIKLAASSRKSNEITYTYSIAPIDAGGKTALPEGYALVMIRIDGELKGKVLTVCDPESGKLARMRSWEEGEQLCFITTRFGDFEIIAVDKTENGSVIGIVPMIMIIAAGVIMAASVAIVIVVITRSKRK